MMARKTDMARPLAGQRKNRRGFVGPDSLAFGILDFDSLGFARACRNLVQAAFAEPPDFADSFPTLVGADPIAAHKGYPMRSSERACLSAEPKRRAAQAYRNRALARRGSRGAAC